VLPVSPPYSDGRFSNGNVWVQDVDKDLGLPALKPSLDGGRDYAYGGAEAGNEPLHTVTPIDLPSQLAQFIANVPHPEANALYTLSIGANDLLDAIPAYANNPSQADADIQAAVNNESLFLQGLAADGAENFLILNVPDLGKTPQEAGNSAVASQLSSLYDSELDASLKTLVAQEHLNIYLVDTYTLIDEGVADPAKYGLKNVTTPVWTGNYENPFSGTLNAHGSQQNTYLFFDHLHPTAKGHEIVASAALSALGKII
jgi:phospholipase/lecithinase/hemolysin